MGIDSTPLPGDRFYIIAAQRRDKGRAWDFVAGPYDSEAAAKASQAYAVEEYAARKHQPEWFKDAEISIAYSDMRIPTALGPIQAKEHRCSPSKIANGPVEPEPLGTDRGKYRGR